MGSAGPARCDLLRRFAGNVALPICRPWLETDQPVRKALTFCRNAGFFTALADEQARRPASSPSTPQPPPVLRAGWAREGVPSRNLLSPGQAAGRMFMFMRSRLAGSTSALISARRDQLAPKAFFTRPVSSSGMKLT